MIDFIILDLSYIGVQNLLNCPEISFFEYNRIDIKTGELIPKEITRRRRKCVYYGQYKNLRFFIYKNNEINLEGSLHTFFNNGKHNANDFRIDDLIQVLDELRVIGLDPSKTKIKHLEFAVNLMNLPYSSPQIINNLMIHSGSSAPQIFKSKYFNTPSEFVTINGRDHFTLKIYDKAKQFNIQSNIFRVEVKHSKGSTLKKIGLSTLEDLTRPEILKRLGELLIQRWDEILLNDWTIRKEELSPKDRFKLKDYSNTRYWIELYEETREKNRNKYRHCINDYERMVQFHSENVHQKIKSEIGKKWCEITTNSKSELKDKIVQFHPYIVCEPALLSKFNIFQAMDKAKIVNLSSNILKKTRRKNFNNFFVGMFKN